MSLLNLELSSVLAGELGWTLVHFLWQGLLLALLLQVILPLCRSAVARHNWALGTLAAMCAAPVITFLWLHADAGAASVPAVAAFPKDIGFAPGGLAPAPISLPWTGWLVGFWLAGITLLSLRALGGLVLAQGLRRGGFALPEDLLLRCHSLQRRVAVSLPVRFLQSRHVTVPMVVGWLRPVILIPVAAIAGLAPQQLDALILHELAHIRRLDAFINVMLIMAETVLFYHPAIWWVSRRVRIEREHCCDDVAVAHCGSAAIYVEALASLETGRALPALALAANGGRLKDRAARLLGAASDRSRFPLSAVAGLAFLGLVIGTVATAQINTQVTKPDFAIRVVDESAGKDALQGPAGEDRVRMAQPGGGALWLKRAGKIDGDALADAYAGVDHGKPVIYFRLTPKGAGQFSEMTRENLGHRLAVVVNGTVITAPNVMQPILGGRGQLTGDFTTEAEAKTLADEMMGTKHPAAPAHDSRQGAISNGKSLQRVSLNTVPAASQTNKSESMTVDQIEFKDNSAISDGDLAKEVRIMPHDAFSRDNMKIYVERIYTLYRRSGKYFARIEPQIIVQPQHRVNLVFTIIEGPTIGVERINFVGNKAFNASDLRAQLATKETQADPQHHNDNYDPDRVTYDRELLRRFYVSHGYVNFRVLSAAAQLTSDKKNFDITYAVDEGSHENDVHFGP